MTTTLKDHRIDPVNLMVKVRQILEPSHVHYETWADGLVLAIVTNMHYWAFGKGGYGKSSMFDAVFTALGLMPDTFIQSFGQGMTPEKLLGNIDLRAMEVHKKVRYKTEASFMKKTYALFEEMPDAALATLFILKDMLERGVFSDGAEQTVIDTRMIVVNSNKPPSAIAEAGSDAEALIQRFVLEANIEWPTHGVDDYKRLLEKRCPKMPGPVFRGAMQALAELFALASMRGETIPPRIALAACKAVQGMAAVNNHAEVKTADFKALRYVRGLAVLGTDVERQVADQEARNAAFLLMATLRQRVDGAVKAGTTLKTPLDCIKWVKGTVNPLMAVVAAAKVTDDLVPAKTEMLKVLGECDLEGRKKAFDLTHV